MSKVSLVQGGKKIVGGKNAGTYTYDKTSGSYNKNPAGEVLGVATDQKYAGASLKDLSIGLANDNAQRTQESSMLKDLSVGLAQGKNITQNKINSARTSGASLLGGSTMSTSTSSITGGTKGKTANQTGIAGAGGRYSRYGVYGADEPVIEEPSYEEISQRLMKEAQKEVNSLYKYQNSLLADQQKVNDENLRQNAAVNTLTGLAGSSEANVTTQRVSAQNEQANQKIRDQVNTQVQSVLSAVRKDARDMYQFERQQYNVDMATAEKMRTEMYTKAVTNTTMLAQSGATAEGYKQTDPEGYQHLATQVGGEDVLKAMFTLNRPQDKILDKKIEGGKYVIAFQNPIDGKIRIESVDLGLPPQYTKTVDAGDRILAIPENWDGDPANLITINKGLTPSQAAGGGGAGADEQLYTGLSSSTATAVRSKVTKFSSEPMVQNFAVVQEGNEFAQSISETTKNPAEHQALIYALAKALDPGSVVREGEYATAQKYAQSWVAAFGTGVSQALLGTGFLSEDAIKNIKSTIALKSKAAETTYANLQNQYVQSINSLTGRSDGQRFLVDYAYQEQAPVGGVLRSPDGTQEVNVSELTPEELQEARNAGWQ